MGYSYGMTLCYVIRFCSRKTTTTTLIQPELVIESLLGNPL
jgi:hypothetical protein